MEWNPELANLATAWAETEQESNNSAGPVGV